MPREDLIAIRRGTAADWTSANPTLSSGEQGFETDTNKLKIGDGSTAWNSLDYITGEGGSSLEYQTEITTDTTLDGTQKGLNKVYPVNSATAKEITITTGDYVLNDVINIERRGQGSVEIVADTGVRIRGVRNIDNEYFINDVNSMVALLCRGSEEFGIIGNLTRGYTGAVTTTSYGSLGEGDTAVDVAVIGTGFSENMLVTVSANATQSSAFTYNSPTSITLHLTVVGVEDDTVTVTYDNGDVYVDTDAITIEAPAVPTLYDTYPFEVGYALFQLNSAITYGVRIRRLNDDAETDIGFNASGKVALDSPVSSGGDLTTWIGSNDGVVVTRYNQGSTGSADDQNQSTESLQGLLIDAGVLVVNTVAMIELDGVGDSYSSNGSADRDDGDFTLFTMTRKKVTEQAMIMTASFPQNVFQLKHATGGEVALLTTNDSGVTVTATTAGTLSIDTNYKVVALRESTTPNQEIWIDGSSDATATPASTHRTDSVKLTSGNYANASNYLDGFLVYEIYYKSDQSANRTAIQTVIDSAI